MHDPVATERETVESGEFCVPGVMTRVCRGWENELGPDTFGKCRAACAVIGV